MSVTYKAMLKNGRIYWIDEKPSEDQPINVRITVVDEEDNSERADRGDKMADILARLAETDAFSSIDDPVQWQKEVRKDRNLFKNSWILLIDSNIIIYASRPEYGSLRSFIREQTPYVSAISKVEVLGYHKLDENERNLLTRFFEIAFILPVSEEVINEATELRRKYNMSLGDALIAATATIWQMALVTRNTKDFKAIQGLEILDPLEE